tara:strand:+ start:363 stop:476 length:114 start_codon:yes stop_codon:yes gene_type:complete
MEAMTNLRPIVSPSKSHPKNIVKTGVKKEKLATPEAG